MIGRALIRFALTLAPLAWNGLAAQVRSDSIRMMKGSCSLWSGIPGTSSGADSVYNRCALDQPPVLREGEPMPPAPWFSRAIGGSLQVIVDADGRVDQNLTRPWSRSTDTATFHRALETIRRWRFEPGIRDGVAVRSGFELVLQSNVRDDTIPARLEWSYWKGGTGADTLRGEWVAEPLLPPFDAGQVDSIYAALLRRLLRMQVLVPSLERRYCIVLASGDSADHARISMLVKRVLHPLAPNGCERIPAARRVVLPQVYRTENGRAVLYPSGDDLENWPPGLDGVSWRTWTGRCVADVPERSSVLLDCEVRPLYDRDELVKWGRDTDRRASFRAAVGQSAAGEPHGDTVRVSLFVTTRGAYWIDTLSAVVTSIPRLRDRAVVDTASLCAGSWRVRSPQSAAVLLVFGDPDKQSLHISRASQGELPRAPGTPSSCGPDVPRLSSLAAFLLGDVGDRATEPIALCFWECTRRYVVDPSRHTIAEHAHVRFRRSDLRADTRAGEQLIFRIRADPVPPGLLPLVVVRSRGRWPYTAWVPKQTAPDSWDYGVIFTGGYPEDTEVYVYLVAR